LVIPSIRIGIDILRAITGGIDGIVNPIAQARRMQESPDGEFRLVSRPLAAAWNGTCRPSSLKTAFLHSSLVDLSEVNLLR